MFFRTLLPKLLWLTLIAPLNLLAAVDPKEIVADLPWVITPSAEWQGSLASFPESTQEAYALVLKKAFQFVARHAPRSGRHSFHWEGARDRLGWKEIKVIFTNSRMMELNGIGRERTMMPMMVNTGIQSMIVLGGPNRSVAHLLLIVRLDRVIYDPANNGAPRAHCFTDAATALAGQLLGYFADYLKLYRTDFLTNALHHDSARVHAIQQHSFEAEAAFLDNLMADADFSRAPPEELAFARQRRASVFTQGSETTTVENRFTSQCGRDVSEN